MSEEQTKAAESQRGRSRVLQGIVRSNAMDKTVVVEISSQVKHKKYKKYVRRRKRYKAHDERNEYLVGDVVRIVAARPLSKQKHWRVQRLVERPK